MMLQESWSFKAEKALPVIAAATVLFYTIYKVHVSTQKKEKKGVKRIPEPDSAYPYFGHMLTLGDQPSIKIAEWHQELGPLIQLRMGVHHWVSVNDPVLAHKIFVTSGTETSFRPLSAFAYHHYSLEGKGIGFAQPGAGWKEARSAVVSVLAPKQIEKYMDSISEKAETLALQLMESTEKEGSANPHMHLELFSLNVMSSACFGKTFTSIQDPGFIELVDLITESMKLAGLENDLPNFLPAFAIYDYFAGTQKKMQQFVKLRRDPVCKALIKFALEQEGPNIVKSFEENGFLLDEDDRVVMMFDLVGGGSDTVSITLTWNFAIMCCYPEEQRRAAVEIDTFIKANGRLPNFKERLQLPYCVSVVKECMRFRPTTSFGIPHAVDADVIVEGYIIPKGATLITNMESLHKNPNIYPEPDTFYPDRFANNLRTMQAAANGRLEDRDHFNFGWGRRICPAIYLAEVEVFTAFVNILSRCFIEPADAMPNLDKAQNVGINLLAYPYDIKFTRRTDALI